MDAYRHMQRRRVRTVCFVEIAAWDIEHLPGLQLGVYGQRAKISDTANFSEWLATRALRVCRNTPNLPNFSTLNL